MKWINTKKKLPNDGLNVLVISMGEIKFARFINGKFIDKEYIGEWQEVTHWIHFPKINELT